MKFINLSFSTFPSKFQIINRKETRKKKFQVLLNEILGYAREYPNYKKRIFVILYAFLSKDLKIVPPSAPDELPDEKNGSPEQPLHGTSVQPHQPRRSAFLHDLVSATKQFSKKFSYRPTFQKEPLVIVNTPEEE